MHHVYLGMNGTLDVCILKWFCYDIHVDIAKVTILHGRQLQKRLSEFDTDIFINMTRRKYWSLLN